MIRIHCPRDTRHRPIGNRWNCCGQIQCNLPAIAQVTQKRAQSNGCSFGSCLAQPRDLMFDELDHVGGAQL